MIMGGSVWTPGSIGGLLAGVCAAITLIGLIVGGLAGWWVDRRMDVKLAPINAKLDSLEHEHSRNGGVTSSDGRLIDGTVKDISAETFEIVQKLAKDMDHLREKDA